MPLRKSKGNMYDWVGFTHSHIGGECPHHCAYCYVNNPRFGRPPRYQGELRMIEKEFNVNYGEGRTIFIENCTDLFAEAMPREFIERVLAHCCAWPKNTYVFQSKNPKRMFYHLDLMPPFGLLGTTIESDRWHEVMGKAPPPAERVAGIGRLSHDLGKRCFVTVEPILDLDVKLMISWLYYIKPEFVNVGADSKGHGLDEPSGDKVRELLAELKKNGITVKEKNNLSRLLGSVTQKG
jgi:hypothetical protein